MNVTRASRRVKVTGDGKGVAGHAGALLFAELADRVGLTQGLSAAMAHTRQRRSAHDPGVVLAHLTVSLANGGDCLADVAVLRNQPELFGSVASDPTVWRVIDSIHADGLRNIAVARAAARARVWAAGVTPSEVVIDIDGTLLDAHSEKQDATPTYKRGFGFYPIVSYLDTTGEALAGLLRSGNAGSTTPQITSRSWTGPSPNFPSRRTTSRCWCAPTPPARHTTSWTAVGTDGCGSRSAFLSINGSATPCVWPKKKTGDPRSRPTAHPRWRVGHRAHRFHRPWVAGRHPGDRPARTSTSRRATHLVRHGGGVPPPGVHH